MFQPGVIAVVVSQHAEELASLWSARRALAKSGYASLRDLGRFDDRIRAHADGCVVAGPAGRALLDVGLADADAAPVFASAVVALDAQDRASFERCLAVAETIPRAIPGIMSALGWTAKARLAGIVKDMLGSTLPLHRRLGLTACRFHAVDPGVSLEHGLRDDDRGVRIEALRTAGHLGRCELVTACRRALEDADADCQFWAAWSAGLLGIRGEALEALKSASLAPGPHRVRAFPFTLQALDQGDAHAMLQQLAIEPQNLRWVIQGSGVAGDASYVPWLINHMAADKTARLAGEAFSLITGADLASLDLERKPPDDIDAGPNDDPDDPNVDMDPDEGLAWPDADHVRDWWVANGGRFTAGTRYFIGAPVTREHCVKVLKAGYQRQRILAAHYLCLLDPGTPLFNTRAPAWRQQRLLAEMR